MSDAASALNDLADEVAAAADLDDAARRGVDFSLEVSDPELAICDALIDAKTPLPAGLLKRIRAGVEIGRYHGATRDEVIAALDRQERHHKS